jgi:hypothetical protein
MLTLNSIEALFVVMIVNFYATERTQGAKKSRASLRSAGPAELFRDDRGLDEAPALTSSFLLVPVDFGSSRSTIK